MSCEAPGQRQDGEQQDGLVVQIWERTLLRIPNPGSDINQFIRTFRDLHPYLKDLPEFDLDQMTRAMVARNNVTSQGAVGQQALARSTRDDRSRDPLYNQSKMYSELYRALGWIHSTNKKLTFRITPLGHHLATANDPKALAKECFLSMAFPNGVLAVKGSQSVRIFGTMLIALSELGTLSRNELIIGPMSMDDDRELANVDRMIAGLRAHRKKPGSLAAELKRISSQRKISVVTMGNYVRIPMAVPLWAGWATRGGPGVLAVTAEGIQAAQVARATPEFRLADFMAVPVERKKPLIVAGSYRLLERAGFDISAVAEPVARYEVELEDIGQPTPHFSPFQQLGRKTIELHAAEMLHVDGISELDTAATSERPVPRQVVAVAQPMLVQSAGVRKADRVATLEQYLRLKLQEHDGDVYAAAAEVYLEEATSNKDAFYPLICDLLTVVGFNCRLSRHGVNATREDALIVDPGHACPVEIKSPGEELELSVKGVRQALENKIILLAKNDDPPSCTRATTSLVVGYNPPNERSEVHELIEDIWRTFRINVGVIDFLTLLILALNAINQGVQFDLARLREFRGVLHVEIA